MVVVVGNSLKRPLTVIINRIGRMVVFIPLKSEDRRPNRISQINTYLQSILTSHQSAIIFSDTIRVGFSRYNTAPSVVFLLAYLSAFSDPTYLVEIFLIHCRKSLDCLVRSHLL